MVHCFGRSNLKQIIQSINLLRMTVQYIQTWVPCQAGKCQIYQQSHIFVLRSPSVTKQYLAWRVHDPYSVRFQQYLLINSPCIKFVFVNSNSNHLGQFTASLSHHAEIFFLSLLGVRNNRIAFQTQKYVGEGDKCVREGRVILMIRIMSQCLMADCYQLSKVFFYHFHMKQS